MAIKEIRDRDFFEQDALTLAHDLLGKIICHRKFYGPEKKDEFINRGRIVATEAYLADESVNDANRSKKPTTQFLSGGHLHFHKGYERIDIVANKEGIPESVLIREIDPHNGPSLSVWALDLDSTADGVDLVTSNEIWLEDDAATVTENEPRPRVGLSEKTATKEEINAKQHYSVKEITFK